MAWNSTFVGHNDVMPSLSHSLRTINFTIKVFNVMFYFKISSVDLKHELKHYNFRKHHDFCNSVHKAITSLPCHLHVNLHSLSTHSLSHLYHCWPIPMFSFFRRFLRRFVGGVDKSQMLMRVQCTDTDSIGHIAMWAPG